MDTCFSLHVRSCVLAPFLAATLVAFAVQGAKEDAEAVGKGADVVLHKAVAAAEQLPTALEHLPGTAGAALPGLQARAEKAAGVAKEQASSEALSHILSTAIVDAVYQRGPRGGAG